MKPEYDLIVIGGGSGGLTAAIGGAQIGAKTLLFEGERIGGDCTHSGCIPSKTLIKAGKVARTMQEAKDFGFSSSKQQKKHAIHDILAYVQSTREKIAATETPEILEQHGVEVISEYASFVDANSVVSSSGKRFTARKIVIATGSSPRVPQIEGLEKVSYMTNESIFLPREFSSLVVIGGGPIGSELAQAFAHLGVEVSLIESNAGVLSREDSEASRLIGERFSSLGISLHTQCSVEQVSMKGKTVQVQVSEKDSGTKKLVKGDALLIAIGRTPNVESLGLEQAGVAYDKRGIFINRRSQTSQSHIYAVGDVARTWQFTHYANHMAKIALGHLIFRIPAQLEQRVIPRVTYTTPEVASVGISEDEVKNQGLPYQVLRKDYSAIDRAITDNEETGFMKIIVDKKGKIQGATLVGEGAGELIGEIALAMQQGITITKLADTIHPYPTYGYGLRTVADQFRGNSYTSAKKRWVQKIFRLRGDQ